MKRRPNKARELVKKSLHMSEKGVSNYSHSRMSIGSTMLQINDDWWGTVRATIVSDLGSFGLKSELINDKMKFRCLWAISNETVAGIEISFKEKDTKYLEFLFEYYMDDLIREDYDWELFDRLSLRKRRNIINLNMHGPTTN
ncbi:hypothetical protein F8388_009175 [Cannabis sativa]|uniref:Ycf2 N-terminal domain-containing protein n=1 Tax=Cannabis sativa TaxID=3483 RepID=A0A7J6GJN8_CANSA|nr:hypothetical protein F8388_009175 [Cannabis sativa]